MADYKKFRTLNDFDRFHIRYQKTDTCWVWMSQVKAKPNSFYGLFWFGENQKIVAIAHRVAWFVFRGEDPGPRHVLHHCDNGLCVNPEHLYLGDNSRNIADKVERARGFKGSPRPEMKFYLMNPAVLRHLASKHSKI